MPRSLYLDDFDDYLPRRFSCSDRMCGGDDCDNCFPSNHRSSRNDISPDDEGIDELISDAEASGLINGAIDRCFEATVNAERSGGTSAAVTGSGKL